MPSTTNYAIVVRRHNGEVETRQPTSLAFTYIASSITITLGMLSTPMAQQALTAFALELDAIFRPPGHLDRDRAEEVVRLFTRELYARFPVVVIDEQLAEGGALGCIQRTNPGSKFNTRDHYIHVNAAELLKMRTAATRSITDFRTWQFIFANILCHEIAHLFVTFLGNTRPGTVTPPTIGCGLPGVYTDGVIKGEAGRWLEYVLFGGTFELYQDPDRQDDQAAEVPRILSAGRDCVTSRKISRDAIYRTLNYDFCFPYSFEGPLRYATPRQWSQENESTFYHPIGPLELALMAPGQSQGYDVHIGERSTFRNVPHDISARVEQA